MKAVMTRATTAQIFLLVPTLIVGCASSNLLKTGMMEGHPVAAAIDKTDAAKAVQESEHDHRQHKMSPKPNGVISLDVVEKNGKIYLLLGEHENGRQSVVMKVSRDGGKSWTQPVRMGDETGLHGDVAIDANGRLVVVWDAIADDGLAIFAAERLHDGKFTEPVKLSAPGARAAFPRVVPAGKKFLVVWTQSKDGKREELAMQHF